MTNCIVSHLAPRDAKRRTKKNPTKKRAKRLKQQFKKHNGRKPRRDYRAGGNKYMTHVLSYINDDEAFWDEFRSESVYIWRSFDQIYQFANARGVHFLHLAFTKKCLVDACEKEFVASIKPNLTEEKFTNIDANRLYMWCKISTHEKLAESFTEDAKRVLNFFSKFSKSELHGFHAVMKFYPALHAWAESDYGRNSVLGEKVPFTVKDAKKFVAVVKDHNLQHKIHRLSEVFEDRIWHERIDRYYSEADDGYRKGNCVHCKAELWANQMESFKITNGDAKDTSQFKCADYHCIDCTVKILKENREEKRPIFSCGHKCKCFLALKRADERKSYAYLANKLDMKETDIQLSIAEDFETCVMAPYRLLPEKVAAKTNDSALAGCHRRLRGLCSGSWMDFVSDEITQEASKLDRKLENLFKMGRLREHLKQLDEAISNVVSATLSKKDEEMLSSVKSLCYPIRSVIENRPSQSEDLPELYGLTMLDIANSKLQRAKDVATTAYSIAKQCAICTTVVSLRGSEEDLITLHDDLAKDVEAWRNRLNMPCHACKDCFGNYMKFKTSLGKPVLRCPGMNCRCFLDKKRVEAAMPNAFDEYKTAMMRFELKRVENYRTCPNADCASGIVLDACCNADQVTCTACTTSFCPKCNDEPHEGMTCEEFQRKRHEERWGEAKDYMKNETKQCPYCLVWIEKNGGCNHMTCHHCRGEFCWLCFGEWHTHVSCEEKNEVTRRPFNELFPNWQEKKKTLKPRFHVGKYVTLEPHTDQYIGRVVSTQEHGIYQIESVEIPGIDSIIKGTLKVEESLLRGYNQPIPVDASAEKFEEESYASFLAGFDVDESLEKVKEAEQTEYISVELVLKDASDSESGDSAIHEVELPFVSFLKGFNDSDDEDSEEFAELAAQLAELDGVNFYGNSHELSCANRDLKTLHARKTLRAKREKVRENVVSIADRSDEEDSELAPAWLLFINNEATYESESEDESSSDYCGLFDDDVSFDSDSSIEEDLGFESDDEEESS